MVYALLNHVDLVMPHVKAVSHLSFKAYVVTIGNLATVLSLTTNIKFFEKFQKVQIKCEFFVLR